MPVAIPLAAEVGAVALELTAAEAAGLLIVSSAIAGVVSYAQQQDALNRAKERKRIDNVTMVRSAEAPHRVVYGRARVSGPIAFTHSTGTENGDLYIIVCLTGHEIDGIEEIDFNETQLGVTSGDVVQGSTYFAGTLTEHPVDLGVAEDGNGNTIPTGVNATYALDSSLQFSFAITGALGSVSAVYTAYGQPPYFGYVALPFSLVDSSGGNVVIRVNDPAASAGLLVIAAWSEWSTAGALVNVQGYLGTATQAADPMLLTSSDGKWTFAHQLKGRSYIRAKLIWNFDRFIAGIPNISARIRGRKVYDPRSATDPPIWSSNSALCIRDYLTNVQFGLGATSAELDETSFIASANSCDELISVDLNAITPEALQQKWRDELNEGMTNGTWTASPSSGTIDLVSSIGSLSTHSGGTLTTDSTRTIFNYNVLNIHNTSGGFAEYVALPMLGVIANGDVTVRFGLPDTTRALGMTFRTTAIGTNDAFNGYRIDCIGGGSQVRLFRSTGTSLVSLGSALLTTPPPTPPYQNPVVLRVVFNGSSISVYEMGILKISVTDATWTTGTVRLLSFANPPGSSSFMDVDGLGVATVFTQPRYTTNGVFTVDRTPNDILNALLASCAGQLSYTGGVFRLVVGVYQTPILTLGADDLRGPISVLPNKPRRELFNSVRGVYASKGTFDQPTDYPPVTNATYQTEDGGERIDTQLDFEFVNDSPAAQRIAKIHLEKQRQAITFQAPCKMSAIALRPGDTVMWTLPRMGWTAKVFRVEGWSLRLDQDFGVDLVLQEEAAANYDWNYGNATLVDPAPNTGLTASLMVQPDVPQLLDLWPDLEEILL